MKCWSFAQKERVRELAENAGNADGSASERAAAERATGRIVDKLMRRLAPRLKDGTVGPREILDAFGLEVPDARDVERDERSDEALPDDGLSDDRGAAR